MLLLLRALEYVVDLEPRETGTNLCAPSCGLVRGEMRRLIAEREGPASHSAAAAGRGDGGGERHILRRSTG